MDITREDWELILFLYIDPLKQGLKLAFIRKAFQSISVFIHRSIKTRIETCPHCKEPVEEDEFLYIDPLKQGLKLLLSIQCRGFSAGFYT